MPKNKGYAQAMRPMMGSDIPVKTCRWLDGEPKELNWCGDAVKRGSSYCPAHYKRVYLPPQKREAGKFSLKRLGVG